MTNLQHQKRLAAKVLNVGVGRVWFDPEESDTIAEAVTREDIRDRIEEGIIKKKPVKGVSRGRARIRAEKRRYGHLRGHGKRKGAKYARLPKKKRWITKIRAQRRLLKRLRDDNTLDRSTYRMIYNKAGGGEFRDLNHLKTFIESHTSEV
ncbi:MAG: 50S ribosomal protein L19e [Candidatus Syntrophoarchaeum sp.]|nr:50S ribosomal protein L19e [Candidatus Syntrophoarchaeum sp.]